jgi:hypothetical protein
MMNWIKKFLKKEEVLWESIDKWDPNYKVKVIRMEPYVALLKVSYKGKVFFQQTVHIAYDAKYGIDYSDLESWAFHACEATQAHERTHGGVKSGPVDGNQ